MPVLLNIVFEVLVTTIREQNKIKSEKKTTSKCYNRIKKNIFPQFVVIHRVKGSSVVNKAEGNVFLELSCFFNYPADVGNLISGSSGFSQSSLNIWNFTVHILLKPGLENFEYYFASM